MSEVDTGWSYQLTQAYLAALPVSRNLWGKAVSALSQVASSDPVQEDVLVDQAIFSSVDHPVARKYPRDPQHQMETLKYLQEVFFKRSGNQSLKLAERIKACEVDIESQPQLVMSYKTYVYDTKFFAQFKRTSGENREWDEQCCQSQREAGSLTLLESCGRTAHWTTGLTSWGGGAVMADWVNSTPQVVKGKAVLELGSGVGYLAAAILKQFANEKDEEGGPLSYIATDCHPQVLRVLSLNLTSLADKHTALEEYRRRQELMSQPPEQETEETALPCETNFVVSSVQVQVLPLDWLSPPCPSPPCDVILAADVVYDAGLTPHLVTTIRSLLQNSTSPAEACAYIACTRRNQESIAFFLECVKEQEMSCLLVYKAVLDIDFSLFVFNESHLPIQIFKISLS